MVYYSRYEGLHFTIKIFVLIVIVITYREIFRRDYEVIRIRRQQYTCVVVVAVTNDAAEHGTSSGFRQLSRQ